jgi:hypothetical protein
MQLSDDSPRITSHFVSRLIGSLIPVPPENATSPPGVTPRSSVPCRPHTPWYDGWVRIAFAAIVPARPCPVFGRPVHHGVASSITARYFSASPSDSTSRWTPCPPVVSRQLRRLRLPLGLSPPFPAACPFRRYLIAVPRPARRYPRFWIWRPLPGRQWDFNPPDLGAAQHTLCGL